MGTNSHEFVQRHISVISIQLVVEICSRDTEFPVLRPSRVSIIDVLGSAAGTWALDSAGF